MKLTTARLKKLIREEMQKLNELKGSEKREKFDYNGEDIHVFLVNDMQGNDALSRIKDDNSHGEQGFYVVNENGDLRKELDKKRKVKNWDKKNYPPVPEKYLYDMYCRVIDKESPDTFLKNLKSACKDYINLINPSNTQIFLSSLKAMGVNKCFPLLLDVKNKFSSGSKSLS